ncbi:MAG: hypothetical protein DRI57_07540 [Deltaproteobacteria bacterium]|nr:MAG: hypothetical protein DRI57_07540 [Deltaproteobacteria bacterium]
MDNDFYLLLRSDRGIIMAKGCEYIFLSFFNQQGRIHFMKRLLVILIVAVLFSLPATALAEKVVFGTAKWPPYVMVSEKGQISGLDVEIVQEMCKRLKIEAKFWVLPWKRAVKYTEKGKVDAIFAMRHNEERAKFAFYPSEPILMERTVILARKGSGIKITKVDDLNDKIVGVVRGYAYSPEFDKHQGIKKSVCDDDEQVVKMFGKKRILLAAGIDEGSMKYLCKKNGVEAEAVYVLNEVPGYIAVSKKAMGEKGKALADKFAETLRQMKKEGVIEKIKSKYF